MANSESAPPVRVAIYARYSSDLQRPSSIVDQVRQCTESLEELVRLAEQKPRLFEGIIIDDTSRFGRNLSDTLPLSDILENANVFLYFANCNLDSRDPNFRLLFIAYGQQDEQASRRLAERVHRGQRGRVLKGYLGSGRVFGYNNVPIEDPTRKGLYGRPYVEAVKLEINPEEAAIVLRIFRMYVGGLGCRAIAMKLNAEGVPSPLKGQSRHRRLWSTFAVSGILTNEKYRGIHIWNRTKVVRNPRTHRKERRRRPETEWERVIVPEWRIVTEEIWAAAVETNSGRQGPNWFKVGGLNRSAASLDYIFSGVLVCGECGGRFNVIAGKGPKARYGCAGHRFNGTCQNGLTILRRVLEERLVYALTANLRVEQLREYLIDEFHARLNAAWKDRSSKSPRTPSSILGLKEKSKNLKHQAENLIDAIAATQGSTLLYERLSSIESQIRGIDELLATQKQKRTVVPSAADIQAFLDRRLGDLESFIGENPTLAKQLVLQRVSKLVMDPMYPADGPTYEVRGDVGLFAGTERRSSCSLVKDAALRSRVATAVA